MNASEIDVQRSKSTPNESDTMSHLPAKRRRSRGADTLLAKTNEGLKNALLALLERKQFEQISIREICAEAGIHYATFFRRHGSKEEFLDHVAADQIEGIVALTLPILDTRKGFVALFEYVNEHRALWTTLLTGGAAPTMRATLMGLATKLSSEIDHVTGKVPLGLARAACVTIIVEAITWWLTQPPEVYSTEQMAEYVEQLVQPCLSRK